MITFTAHDAKTFNNWESPWINNKVETFIQEENKIYQLYLKNQCNILTTEFETLQNLTYETLESYKSKYFKTVSKKLCSKVTALKYC